MQKNQLDVIKATSISVFGTKSEKPQPTNELFAEALSQMVLPLVIDIFDRSEVPQDVLEINDVLIANNLRVCYEHSELHNLLSIKRIPYTCLKGCSSGLYYPKSNLRTYGDVDFYVSKDSFKETQNALEELDFVLKEDTGGKHASYFREPNSIWELHREIYSFDSDKSQIVNGYLESLLKDSINVTMESFSFTSPSHIHHGLILLIHTATHLIGEGIGLRHLCDWAVFIDKDYDYLSANEKMLCDCGLYTFANVLTEVCNKYLLKNKVNCEPNDDAIVDMLMDDIMAGGNFGHKDDDRYRQIKYIANRSDGRVDSKNSFSQLFDTINQKSKSTNKSRLSVILEYVKMVLSKDRKLDSKQTIKNASKRKALYSKLEIFK